MITFPLLLSVIAKMQNTICAFLLSCPVRGTWIEISAFLQGNRAPKRRAPYGARGLKSHGVTSMHLEAYSRAPYGARGLKSDNETLQTGSNGSCPVRGTWIEIPMNGCSLGRSFCRAPYGARGLKLSPVLLTIIKSGRAPYGARGLK